MDHQNTLMKKFLVALALVFFGAIWVAGCHTEVLNALYRSKIIPDDYRYGDLYRLANLAEFKELASPCAPYSAPRRSGDRPVALYIIGDSFAEAQRIDSADFAVDTYQFAHWATTLHLKLDTAFTNIILLESVERKAREHFAAPIYNIVPDTATFVSVPGGGKFMARLDHAFAADPAEERLSTILFEYDFFLKIKEWKSGFTQRFFDRTSPKVKLTPNSSALLYYEDTDSTLTTSSYAYLPETEVDSMVSVLNFDKKYLEGLGFDQVLVSIIPNKASILMPDYGEYNRLIERVYQHPKLGITKIDVLSEFRNLKADAYLKSDSHWSCAGQYVWLKKVNTALVSGSTAQNTR